MANTKGIVRIKKYIILINLQTTYSFVELQITYVYMWGQLDLCGEELHISNEDQDDINKYYTAMYVSLLFFDLFFPLYSPYFLPPF